MLAMKWEIRVIVLTMLMTCPHPSHSLRRCYSCRSRGEKGDCRDPFRRHNAQAPGLLGDSRKNYVDELPCSSGWCSKIMEGVDKNSGDDDHGIATERQCMSRVPSDGKERCAYVKRNHKEVFMCFCTGDLCNNSTGLQAQWVALLSVLSLLINITF